MLKQLRAWMLLLGVLFGILVWAKPSQAYPWMIRHEYTGCAVCHTDPSGGFLLTPYGRALTQSLLVTWGKGPEGDEVDSRSGFAWGVPLPEWLNLGASGREMYLYTQPTGQLATSRFIQMQADLRAMVTAGHFEAAGSIGYVHRGALPAAVTRKNSDNIVSREFWLGYRFGEDQNTVLRAGRLYLPFGIRTIDHTLFVRNVTRTNLDDQQQWGLSLFHQGETYRAEVMAIAGNYQIAPDDYRSRGYSGYAEFVVGKGAGLGLSSLVTYSKIDANLGVEATRGAHGPYLRWALSPDVALLVEADVTHVTPTHGQTEVGAVGMGRLDWEFTRGMHAMLTRELLVDRFQDPAGWWSHREWATVSWFIYPHVDLRVDGIWDSLWFGTFRADALTALGQIHVSL